MAEPRRGAGRQSLPPRSSGSYDGVGAAELAERLGVPLLVAHHTTESTNDEAHRLAELGAPHGSLVISDRQTAGRGRQGKVWHSAAGQGIWLTMLARELDAVTVGVLAARLGLAAATALDAFSATPVRLKWPNDLYVEGGKLAGVLVEARWQGGRTSWVAVGVGLNVRAPEPEVGGAALREGVDRLRVLHALAPALLGALGATGPLADRELAAFAERDLAAGQRCSSPLPGLVLGIAPDGGLRVRTPEGDERTAYAGSLVLEPPDNPRMTP